MKQTTHGAWLPPQVAIFLGILAMSTSAVFIRFAQAEASSLAIAGWRLGIATLVLAPIALARYRGELGKLAAREWALAAFSGAFLALHFATWISSLEYTTVASSLVLVATSPLWVALAAPFTIRERVTRPALLGMGVAFLGAAVIALSDACAWEGGLGCPALSQFFAGEALFGDALALAGALAAAGYLIIGRNLRAKMDLIPYIFVVYGIAALCIWVYLLFTHAKTTGYSGEIYFYLLMLALVPQLLGHSTVNWSLRYLSAGFVSIALLGESIGSVTLAWIFLAESAGAFKTFGAILTLVGIAIASRREQHKP